MSSSSADADGMTGDELAKSLSNQLQALGGGIEDPGFVFPAGDAAGTKDTAGTADTVEPATKKAKIDDPRREAGPKDR